MEEKTMKLSLGGQEYILDIGKFWFTKFYGEFTKGDPFNATQVILEPEKQFDWAVAMVHSGLRSHYRFNRIPFDITKEQVEEWLGDKEDEEIKSIIELYGELRKAKEPGENHVQTAGA